MAHNWMIAEREYARHLERRGRLHAFERLDPKTTALVVVDMVPFFADENPHCRDAIAPINSLASALRDAGGVVAWVLPSGEAPYPERMREFFGERVAQVYGRSGGSGPLPQRLCSTRSTPSRCSTPLLTGPCCCRCAPLWTPQSRGNSRMCASATFPITNCYRRPHWAKRARVRQPYQASSRTASSRTFWNWPLSSNPPPCLGSARTHG